MKECLCEKFDLLLVVRIADSGKQHVICGSSSSLANTDIFRDIANQSEIRQNWKAQIKSGGMQTWAQGEIICGMTMVASDLLVVWSRMTDRPGSDYDRLSRAIESVLAAGP